MTREEAIAWLEDEKEYYETNLLPENDKGSTAYQMAIEALKQPEILTYEEQCIFLAAMGREKKLCENLDKNLDSLPKHSLIFICEEIERKVKATLWRREE